MLAVLCITPDVSLDLAPERLADRSGGAARGAADIHSLADLTNSFEVVRTMQIAPITKGALLRLVAATLAPVVPLALTMMPLEELLKKLLGILF